MEPYRHERERHCLEEAVQVHVVHNEGDQGRAQDEEKRSDKPRRIIPRFQVMLEDSSQQEREKVHDDPLRYVQWFHNQSEHTELFPILFQGRLILNENVNTCEKNHNRKRNDEGSPLP